MASTKRNLPLNDGTQLKKSKIAPIVLNRADCDLDFSIGGNGLQGYGLYTEAFAYCWSGARATVGITGGKYCFGCKIIQAQPADMKDTPTDQQHICHIGISTIDDSVRGLGETANSFGFSGTGKFVSSGNFNSYGEKFGVGDTIVCAVDLESKTTASVGFSKNGKWLGCAKHFNGGMSAFFPHVMLKNVVVQMEFALDDGLIPVNGYKPWVDAAHYGHSMLGPTLSNERDCEVIMMVGLPASGKTTWAEKLVKEHPEKRYVLLSKNLALEQMKVPTSLTKTEYGERFDQLMDRATKISNVLLSRASHLPRNFIIDQTNVYKSARKRMLKPFADYIKIAVVVFPRPDLRFKKRCDEVGKEVSSEEVQEMLAKYTLPMSKDMNMADEYFDQVIFAELSREEAQICLDEMKNHTASKPRSTGSSESSIPPTNWNSIPHFTAPIQSRITPSHENLSYLLDAYANMRSPSPFPYDSPRSPSSVLNPMNEQPRFLQNVIFPSGTQQNAPSLDSQLPSSPIAMDTM